MSKKYTAEEEQRIQELTEHIQTTLSGLGKPIAELFEKLYAGQFSREMTEMLKHLLIAQQQIINAEMGRWRQTE